MKLTLRKTIPSSSHNAPYSEELGEHWPAGQKFKLLGKSRQDTCRKFYRFKDTSTIVEQIGGEEVLVAIPNDQFLDLFGIESPYAQKPPEDRRYHLLKDDENYWVHCPDTGADAVVQDANGCPILESKAVQAWVAENFPGCDVRSGC